eukprot:5647665-Prymnesium_polylepis.2
MATAARASTRRGARRPAETSTGGYRWRARRGARRRAWPRRLQQTAHRRHPSHKAAQIWGCGTITRHPMRVWRREALASGSVRISGVSAGS